MTKTLNFMDYIILVFILILTSNIRGQSLPYERLNSVVLENIKDDVKYKRIQIDREFARSAAVSTFAQVINDPSVVILRLKMMGPGDEPALLSNGGYLSLQDWYMDNYSNGWRQFKVIEDYFGDVETGKMIVVELAKNRGLVENQFPFLMFYDSEWLMALRLLPSEKLGHAPRQTVYGFAGYSIFSAIPVGWPEYVKIPPYFDGVLTSSEVEEMLEWLSLKYEVKSFR